ncbi:hypothetical protein BH09BAC5_BH09BAC5_27530 [soil metagenome]
MEQSNAPVAATRPTFLTVLCILTWIGCIIALIGNVIAYMAAGAVSAITNAAVDNMNAVADSLGSSGSADISNLNAVNETASNVMAHASTVALVSIAGAVLCLVGSFMMWGLKKMGFYIYVVGNLVPVITSAVLLGGSAFGGAMAALGMILPVAFIVMYGLNLKSMK